MTSNDRPDPRMVAAQLRQPSGEAGERVGDRMDEVNEPLFDLTLAAMQPAANERILEIGFGTGTYLPRLLGAAEGLEVHGIDFSADMVARAHRANRDPVNAGRLRLEHGASDALPYPDAHFDKVFSNMVVYFWDEPGAHLAEIHRVLKPGGRFYTGMRTRDSMRQFPFVEYGFVLHEPEEWAAIVERHGFRCREAGRQHDPVIEGDDGDIHLESVCIEAGKR